MAVVQVKKGGKIWKQPKDGKEFVGCLIGGYRDTREKLAKELISRYGIRVVTHFGLEQKHAADLFIPSHVEVCVVLIDDVGPILNRVRTAAKGVGCDVIEVRRKGVNTEWDEAFAEHLYANPPRWISGVDIPKYLRDSKDLEAERLAELQAIDDKPRLAYEDPGLKKPVTLADVAIKPKDQEPLAKTVAQIVAGPSTHQRQRPGKNGTFDPKPSPPGFPAELRAARAPKNWSQGDAAEVIKVAQAMLSSWERGETIPSYECWLKIVRVFPELAPWEAQLMKDGMRGKAAYEARNKVKMAPAPAPYVPPGAKKEEPAPPPPEPTPEPVVETPAPPPEPPKENTVSEVMKTTKEEPQVFAARVIKAMDPPKDERTVKLRSGGTLSLAADVNFFKLKGKERELVFALIDLMDAYEEGGGEKG